MSLVTKGTGYYRDHGVTGTMVSLVTKGTGYYRDHGVTGY